MSKKGLAFVVIVVLALIVLAIWEQRDQTSEGAPATKAQLQTNETKKQTIIQQKETDSIVGTRTSFGDLKSGEIGKVGDIYIGLHQVKVMSYLPTRLGAEEVQGDHEVILGLFEFYNGGKETKMIRPDTITCYADGKQITEVKTYIKVAVDGIPQYSFEQLDPGYSLLSVQDFEVSKGWKEIKFFYESTCIWTVKKEEISSDKGFRINSLFDYIPQTSLTKEEAILVLGHYTVCYKGVMFYHQDEYFGSGNYVVFMYCITNTDKNKVDLSGMSYKIRAYQNGLFLGDAKSLDEKINDYIDLHDIATLEPGMSVNVFVAFERLTTEPNVSMIYNEGEDRYQFNGLITNEAD